MKTNDELDAYLVLSIDQIQRMLKFAKKITKPQMSADGKRNIECVVIRSKLWTDGGGDVQFTIGDITINGQRFI